MDKDNNIIDFKKKKDDILWKEITDYSDIAEQIIGVCFADGQNDYDLAVGLLFEQRVVDEHEELRNTMVSMTIAAIEKKGYWVQANELRKRLDAHLDKRYEKIHDFMQKNNLDKIDLKTAEKVVSALDENGIATEDKEVYVDAEGFVDTLSKSERNRIEALIKKLYADEIDFYNMNKSDAYLILKDVAKYSFYYGFYNMEQLVLDNKRHTVSLTFKEYIPMLDQSKNAFSYLVNIFDEVCFTKNAKKKTITAQFGFNNLDIQGNEN